MSKNKYLLLVLSLVASLAYFVYTRHVEKNAILACPPYVSVYATLPDGRVLTSDKSSNNQDLHKFTIPTELQSQIQWHAEIVRCEN